MPILRKFIHKIIHMNNKILFITSLLFIGFSSIVIYWIEPETFEHPFNSLWWVMTTLTTVGYGDYYPLTVAGKLFAMLLYLTGIGLIGVLIGKILDVFTLLRERREGGKMKFTGSHHVVVVGWSLKSQFAVREILQSHPDMEIVLIDQLERSPISEERIHYVKGDAAKEATLVLANITEAKAAILFADDNVKEPSLADGKSLLTSITIERLAPHVRTTVEIMTEEHIQNFKHVKVDEFILSNETISHMAVRSAFSSGISSVISQLLSRTYGGDLYEIEKRPHWTTYGEAFEELLKEGATLIADGTNLTINQNLGELIPDHARLMVICDKDTYKKVIES